MVRSQHDVRHGPLAELFVFASDDRDFEDGRVGAEFGFDVEARGVLAAAFGKIDKEEM
jgi:hypothetical protein